MPEKRRVDGDQGADNELFWDLVSEVQEEDSRVVEGTIMGGPCVRVDSEFLALVDYKGSGLVVKLPRHRVDELVASGTGQPFGPAGRVFKEWVSIPVRDRALWRQLLREGIDFVS